MSIISKRTGKDIGIQAWGDSLTEATAGSNPLYMRWTNLLAKKFIKTVSILNAGVGGETASQVSARFLGYCKKNSQIQIFWVGRNGVLTLTAGEILSSISSMVARVGDDRFIILSVIPFADGTEGNDSINRNKILSLNAAILSSYPNNYLDLLTSLDDILYRSDGLHLNADGNEIVANSIYQYLKTKDWIDESYYS